MNDSLKNSRIKMVIIAGLIVLLTMICFPPFERVLINRDSGVVIRAIPSGYRFLFSSPEFMGGPFMERVNYGQLGLQVVGWGCLLAIVNLAVSVLTREREKAETASREDLINGKNSDPKANGLKGKGAAELTDVGAISPRTATSEEIGVVLPDALEGPSLPQISEIEATSSALESPSMDASDDTPESTVTTSRPHYPVYTGTTDPTSPYVVSLLITAAICFLQAISTYSGGLVIPYAIGGMIGSALMGGIVALVVWGLNAEIRGKKDFGSAAKVGWVYCMPILAAFSVVVIRA
ncbi:hypothetical protein [Luteolibacter soli]|uniref:Uncharacterized protein n=1 Tax=Luteolibacter soli TaxID=3135280 RepID=A0ABU9ARU2_9BACT